MFRRKKTEKPDALPEEKQQEDLQPHDAQPEEDQNLPADESEETEEAEKREPEADEADAAGELRGRNASIDELTDLMLDSDGVPHASGCGAGAKPKVSTIFDLAREA